MIKMWYVSLYCNMISLMFQRDMCHIHFQDLKWYVSRSNMIFFLRF